MLTLIRCLIYPGFTVYGILENSDSLHLEQPMYSQSQMREETEQICDHK
jgi:hypothetical protein